MMNLSSYTIRQKDEGICIVRDLLTVPTSFLVSCGWKTPTTNARTKILLREEAECMIRVRLLASEIDTLLDLTCEAIIRKNAGRRFSDLVAALSVEGNYSFTTPSFQTNLRTLVPLIHEHSERPFDERIGYFKEEMARCLRELSLCGKTLHQFAQQNLRMAEQIDDLLVDNGQHPNRAHDLLREKLVVWEVEEALCIRINALICDSSTLLVPYDIDEKASTTTEAKASTKTKDEHLDPTNILPLKELCAQLLRDETDLSGNNDNEDEEPEEASISKEQSNNNFYNNEDPCKNEESKTDSIDYNHQHSETPTSSMNNMAFLLENMRKERS